jgi:tetratricopeptide (TPR) repeat protein
MSSADLIEEGIRLQRRGALADAALRYEKALRLEPANVEALHRLAQTACQQGQFELGVDYARQGLTFDPRRADLPPSRHGAWPSRRRSSICRQIEAGYQTMWERSRRGEAPAGFRVNPVEADRVFNGCAQQ